VLRQRHIAEKKMEAAERKRRKRQSFEKLESIQKSMHSIHLDARTALRTFTTSLSENLLQQFVTLMYCPPSDNIPSEVQNYLRAHGNMQSCTQNLIDSFANRLRIPDIRANVEAAFSDSAALHDVLALLDQEDAQSTLYAQLSSNHRFYVAKEKIDEWKEEEEDGTTGKASRERQRSLCDEFDEAAREVSINSWTHEYERSLHDIFEALKTHKEDEREREKREQAERNRVLREFLRLSLEHQTNLELQLGMQLDNMRRIQEAIFEQVSLKHVQEQRQSSLNRTADPGRNATRTADPGRNATRSAYHERHPSHSRGGRERSR
jgi:hypothetical protein